MPPLNHSGQQSFETINTLLLGEDDADVVPEPLSAQAKRTRGRATTRLTTEDSDFPSVQEMTRQNNSNQTSKSPSTFPTFSTFTNYSHLDISKTVSSAIPRQTRSATKAAPPPQPAKTARGKTPATVVVTLSIQGSRGGSSGHSINDAKQALGFSEMGMNPIYRVLR